MINAFEDNVDDRFSEWFKILLDLIDNNESVRHTDVGLYVLDKKQKTFVVSEYSMEMKFVKRQRFVNPMMRSITKLLKNLK